MKKKRTKNYFYNLEGLLPNLSRMLEQLRNMSEPSATAPLRLMLVFALSGAKE